MSSITPAKAYASKDAVTLGFNATGRSAVVGFAASAVQNVLAKHNKGALGVFTRSGGTIAMFGAMGGGYSFVSAASSNLREKDDAWNAFNGGAAAGAVIGLFKRTMPAFFGFSAGTAVLMGLFAWAGSSLGGIYSYMSPEEQEAWKKSFFSTEQRRPKSQILQELAAAPRQG
ncbi:hypothetical protein PYCC9005_003937 [Savitreella phatthalungensis]